MYFRNIPKCFIWKTLNFDCRFIRTNRRSSAILCLTETGYNLVLFVFSKMFCMKKHWRLSHTNRRSWVIHCLTETGYKSYTVCIFENFGNIFYKKIKSNQINRNLNDIFVRQVIDKENWVFVHTKHFRKYPVSVRRMIPNKNLFV